MTTHFLGQVAIGDRLTNHSAFDIEVRQMASGGFGMVYLGPCHLHEDTWLALKTPRSARSKPVLDLFVREALTWIGLWPHANLLRTQTVTIINDQPILVLDYAAGGSLRDLFHLLRQQGRWFSLAEALHVAQHIGHGLAALHAPDPAFLRPFPLVHRDLKPENVLLTAYGYAVITDFGLAKVFEADRLENQEELERGRLFTEDLWSTAPAEAATRSRRYQTARGVALGTPAYMAPEQWDDAAAAGPPAEVYALGLILSELFTGHNALLALENSYSMLAWREAHKTAQPQPLVNLALRHMPALPIDLIMALPEIEEVYQA